MNFGSNNNGPEPIESPDVETEDVCQDCEYDSNNGCLLGGPCPILINRR